MEFTESGEGEGRLGRNFLSRVKLGITPGNPAKASLAIFTDSKLRPEAQSKSPRMRI